MKNGVFRLLANTMPGMTEVGETALYAVYKIKESIINDSCVMRQIRKGEKNVNGDLWYRKRDAGPKGKDVAFCLDS